MEAPSSVRARMAALVEALERTFSAESPWVREAFLKVPRHRFIRRRPGPAPAEFLAVDRHHPSEADLDLIYSDNVVMIHEPPSSASQPYVVSRMLGWLELKPGMKVLEIGTGSGFNAGLLAEGTGRPELVYTVDLQEDLVGEAKEHLAEAGYGTVNVRCADGGFGWAEAAPFDRIIVTAGCADIPPAWLEQLAEGGVLVMPLSTPPLGDLQLRLRKQRGVVSGEFLDVFYFMELQGAFRRPEPGEAGPWSIRDRSLQQVIRSSPGYATGMSWAQRAAFWLFSRSQHDLLFHLEVSWHKVGGHWLSVMADPRAGLYVLYDEHGILKAYGRPGPVWNFGAMVERWKAHGWPCLADYQVTAESLRDLRPADPGEWIDRRPSVALRMRMREGVSLDQA